VRGRVVLRVCALNAMYTWMSISKLATKFRQRARSRLLFLRFVMRRLRCVVASKVADEAFRGGELRLVSLIGMGLARRTEGVRGHFGPCSCRKPWRVGWSNLLVVVRSRQASMRKRK